MRLIDADALKELPFHRLTHTDWGETCVSFEEIDNAPTVDKTDVISYIDGLIDGAEAVRPHGKWIYKQVYDYEYWECSHCGEPWTTIEGTPQDNFMNFCPNCGADMRGDNNAK